MNAKILKFHKRGSFDHLKECESGYWHTVPEDEVINRLFVELRGADNNDYVTIESISEEKREIVQFTGLNGEDPDMSKAEIMVGLKRFVEDNAPNEELAPADIRINRDANGNNTVYAQGDGKVVAVGYYDNAKSDKGMMMAALIMYVFAAINVGNDMTLFENVFSYLPYLKDVGCDQDYYKFAEQLIDELAA